MKTVVFSFILFFATLAAAISNSIYIHETSALLCDAVDALPSVGDSECEAQVSELEGLWAGYRKIVEL